MSAGSPNTELQPEEESIDWSIFESGSIEFYRGAANQWVVGRAFLRTDLVIPHSTDITTPFIPEKLPVEALKGHIGESLTASTAPSLDDSQRCKIRVGFHIARAKDQERKACLQAEVESLHAMREAGLPVLHSLAAFTDRFGNWFSIYHLPPQDALTLREMYIFPFVSKADDVSRINEPPSRTNDMPRNIIDVLSEFLEHATHLVCAIGALHDCGFILRCCRTDSWLFERKDPLHPRGLAILGNATGSIRLEPDTLAENSIAQALVSDRQVTEKWMVHTHAHYLAPEVLGRLNAPVDCRADIFSLGVCLYETVVGHTPTFACDFLTTIHHILAVEPKPPCDMVPGLPKELSDIIMKCLAKAPHDRYYNTDSLRYDLEEVARAWPNRGIPSTRANLVVGGMDDFSRFRLNSELVGVDESLSRIRAALGDADRGDLISLSIQGPSGTGKTALALSISKEVESIGGRLCSGKYDSTSYNRPFAPIWQIINQLALPLLALSDGELEEWRTRIRESVGPSLVQFFERSLDPDLRAYLDLGANPETSSSTTTGTSLPPSYNDAFMGAVIRFVAMFSEPFGDQGSSTYHLKPLVLFFDDVHWATADDFQLFHRLLSEPILRGCLIMFAFRDAEGTPAFLKSCFRRQLCDLPYALHTRLLSKEEIYSEMKNMFKHPNEADDPSLWDVALLLHNQSLGNAQQVKLLLGNLYQNKLVRFDWSSHTWTWDNVQIRNYSTTDSALECWEGILAGQSTGAVREVIFSAAAISSGGIFTLKLLAHSTKQPLSTIIKLVETLALEARVFSRVTAQTSVQAVVSPTSPNSGSPTISEQYPRHSEIHLHVDAQLHQWRFSHDILQQAATVLLPIPQRAVLHSRIGAALSTIQDSEEDEAILRPLVHNLNESRRLGLCASQEDDLRLIRLNIRAAKVNLRSAAGPAALKHLGQAKSLIGADERSLWRLDYKTALSMSEAFVESYTQTAQYRLAVELTEVLLSEYVNDVDKLMVSQWRIRPLIHLDPEAALEFGLRQLADLCDIKIEGSSQVVEMLRKEASFDNAMAEVILESIPPKAPPETVARAAILGSLISVSFAYRRDLAEELSLHAFLAVKEGFTEHSALAYSVRSIFLHGKGMHSEANIVGEVCEALVHKMVSPYSRFEVRLAQTSVAQYSSHTLQEIASLQQRILTDAVYLAHWEYLNWTLGCLYYLQLMGGSNELPFQDKDLIIALQGRVTPSVFNFTLIGEITSSILQGETPLPSSPPFIQLPVPLGPNDSLHQTHLALCETVVAMTFGQPEPELLDKLLACKSMAPGTLHEAYYPFSVAWLIYGLAATGKLKNVDGYLKYAEQEIQTLRNFCERPYMAHNFLMPYRLAEACRLDCAHKHSEAIAILERAIEDTEKNGVTLLLGVAYEYAGKLVRKSIGSRRLSLLYLQNAFKAYEAFGAFAKCAELMGQDSSLGATATWMPNGASLVLSPKRAHIATVADSVDLATLLSVVGTWQREKSASRVATSLVTVLIKTMGARYGALALMGKDNELRLSVAGRLENLRSDLDIPMQKCEDLVPSSLINYALRTKKTILDLDLLREHVGIKKDRFLLLHKPRSILVCPIFEEGSLRGVSYLDSSQDDAFSKSSLELVGLLSTGAAVAIQRAHLLDDLNAQTKGLEDIVRVRTAAAESAAAKAETASLVQARFLQIMSHEMRTPLNSVVVLSDLLLEASLDPVLYEYVLTIKSSSNDLLYVIRDILDFSRLESKSVSLESLPFKISSLIDDTLDQLAEVAANTGIELLFSTHIRSSVPWLLGDSTRVKQCLNNYLSNALKFTNNNGSVTVTVTFEDLPAISQKESPVRVQIAVADTGIGIEDSKIPLLFKKFSQIDKSTTRLFGGSGLGLVIVRELAQLMNGDAWCESVHGKGSTFYFTFEAYTCPEPNGATGSSSFLKAQMFQGKRAVLYGLSGQVAAFLLDNLTWLGFEVLVWHPDKEEDRTLTVDLVLFALNPLTGPPEAVLSKFTETYGDVRFIIIRTRRQTPTQVNIASRTTGTILTPLKVPELSETLLRLFSSDPIHAKSITKNITSKKRHVSFPRLAETCPMKILCVDDNAVNIRVLLQLMTRLGYGDCDVARDGEEAVAKCKSNAYDLILMDLQMPRMDGTTAMGHIQRDQPTPEGPTIIALTASAMSGDKNEALRNGFNASDYISKPIIVSTLIECLRRAYAERNHAEIQSTSGGVKRSSTEPPAVIKRRHATPNP